MAGAKKALRLDHAFIQQERKKLTKTKWFMFSIGIILIAISVFVFISIGKANPTKDQQTYIKNLAVFAGSTDSAKESYDTLHKNIDDANAKIVSLTASIETNTDLLPKLEEEANTKKSVLDDAQKALTPYTDAVASINSSIETLEIEKFGLEEGSDTTEIDSRLDELKTQLEEKTAEMEPFKTACDEAQVEFDEASKTFSDVRTSLSNDKNSLSQLKIDLANYNSLDGTFVDYAETSLAAKNKATSVVKILCIVMSILGAAIIVLSLVTLNKSKDEYRVYAYILLFVALAAVVCSFAMFFIKNTVEYSSFETNAKYANTSYSAAARITDKADMDAVDADTEVKDAIAGIKQFKSEFEIEHGKEFVNDKIIQAVTEEGNAVIDKIHIALWIAIAASALVLVFTLAMLTKGYDRYGYAFIAPFFIVFALFQAYPIFFTFKTALSDAQGLGRILDNNYVGFDNFKQFFDPNSTIFKYFWNSLGNTIIIWLFNFVPQLSIALILASWFTDTRLRLRCQGTFKVMIFMPNIITATTVGMLFMSLFGYPNAPVNAFLQSAGLQNVPYEFFRSIGWSRGLISFLQWWMWCGNTMIIMIAGMSGINPSLFEAALVDGCSSRQTFWKITIPLLRPILLYNLVTSLVGGFTMFDIPYMMTQGNPVNNATGVGSTLTVAEFIFEQAFEGNNNYNTGSAASLVLFVIIMICSIILSIIMKDRSDRVPKSRR